MNRVVGPISPSARRASVPNTAVQRNDGRPCDPEENVGVADRCEALPTSQEKDDSERERSDGDGETEAG